MKRARSYKHRKWRKIILILVFLLSSGSLGQAIPVQAAPSADGLVIYRMKIFMPPDPLCAGKDYSIKVRISADQQYRTDDGAYHDLTSEGVNGKKIEAFARDASIAEVSPRSLMTGWDVDNDGRGEVEFRLKAKKAGSTVLFFEAYIQEAYPIQEPYFGSNVPITVVNCNFEVQANLSYYFRIGPGSTAFAVGLLTTKLESEDHVNYTGNGTFSIMDGAIVPGCAFSYTGWQIPVTITGKIDDSKDVLQLEFAYSPTTASASGSCLGYGVSGSDNAWPSHLPTQASFPVTGGMKRFSIPSPMGPVKGSFSVKPIGP